jgi:hypothetical protein
MIYGITLILLALSAAQEVAPRRDIHSTCDAAFEALFTPKSSPDGRYEVCVTDETVSSGRTVTESARLAEPERLEPLDAFGTAGSYSRSRLVQLYGGRRVTVQRGWREDDGRFESVTLLSPYPDPTLTRLHSGTMIIRWISERR